MSHPNAVWTADFKGQIKNLDGHWCYPLTLVDGCSRYCLACVGLPAPKHELVQPLFERAFREFGLPDVIRTDNGAPFASQAIHRLSRLHVWWIKLGIQPELILPGHPEQNGRHERFHRTLKEATAGRLPRACKLSSAGSIASFASTTTSARTNHSARRRRLPSIARPFGPTRIGSPSSSTRRTSSVGWSAATAASAGAAAGST